MASHTATGEWQSFEIRMRRRRAERLVLRAEVAAEAGCLDDARASLEEARTLWPNAPGLGDLHQKIQSATAAAVGLQLQPPSRWKETAAAVGAMLFIASAAYIFVTAEGGRHTGAPSGPAAAAVADQVSPDTGTNGDAEPQLIAAPLSGAMPQTAATPSAVGTEGTPTHASTEPTHDVSPPPVASTSAVTAPAPGNRYTVEYKPALVSPAIVAGLPEPPSVTPPALAAEPASTAEVASASTVASIQLPQESLVQSTLGHYERAYSALDVDATVRVWPSVNRAALMRAFDSLESQRVTLGDCRIQVDGNEAHASCAGSATWTPKVGNRMHTDERSWSFDLEKAANGWLITNARSQNR